MHQTYLELEVLSVGSVAQVDVRVGDIAICLVEALTPVVPDKIYRLGAGLVLGLKRSAGPAKGGKAQR